MEFIIGVGETEHVTSAQHRAIFERVIGPGSYILDAYELLEPELQSSNSIKIRSGMLSHHGGISEVKKNTYDEVTIANGTQGMKRVDLVVARYERNPETEVEKTSWVVIQGEPSEGTPTVPDYVHGNMQDGDTIDDCPLYEVYLDGIQVTEVRKLLKVLNGGLAELNSNLPISGQKALTAEWNTITFDKPFDTAPTVVVSFVTSTLASSNPVTTKISSVSTTGFKVCLARPEGTYAPGTVNWLAIPRL